MQNDSQNFETRQGRPEKEWSIARSVVASAMATVALNAALGLPRMQEIELDNPFQRPRKTATAPAGTPTEVLVSEEFATDPLEAWARRFSEDARAGELVYPGQVDQIATEILDIAGQYEIKSISLRGHASAEDDTKVDGQRTAGLTTASAKNTELADKRASIFSELLTEKLAAGGLDVTATPVELNMGIEDTLDEQEVAEVERLSTVYGYDDSGSRTGETRMIEAYNRDPQAVPEEVEQKLDDMLARERNVEVDVTYERPQTALETPPPAEQEPEQSTLRLKLPLFLIVPIPLRRRRLVADERAREPRELDLVGLPPRVTARTRNPRPTEITGNGSRPTQPQPTLSPRPEARPKPKPRIPKPIRVQSGGAVISSPKPYQPNVKNGHHALPSALRYKQPREHNFDKRSQLRGGGQPTRRGNKRG